MAIFAFLLEGAVVWIGVASGTSCKIHVLETRRASDSIRLVARFAFHLLVEAG